MVFDPGALAHALIQALLAVMPQLMQASADGLATLIQQRGAESWSGISESMLHSSFNFITRTPPELSYGMGGVGDLYRSWEPAIIGVVSLACVCAGIGILGREHFGWSWVPGEFSARLFLGVLIATSMPRIYIWSIDLLNRITDAILGAELPNAPSGNMDIWTQAVLIVVWIVLGLRLGWRMAYRLIYLDVLLVLGPIAALCWVLPGGESYWKMWRQAFVGMLVGQVLVVLCLRLAAAMGSPAGGTWGSVLLGIGVLLLAYDMATLLAEIKGGGLVGVVKQTIGVVGMARGLF